MGNSAGVKERVLVSGNEAIAEAAIQAGCRAYFGYPITPQNEIPAYMAKRMPEVGGVFLQAESELAAINMVFGASVMGVRVMTSSSSPGISLMQEGISYLAGCQLPAVILNVMRGGPGLGNIGPSQSDYFQATRGGGHGDYRTIVLAPHTIPEAVELVYLAFDLADRYRNPVLLLTDGLLGQMKEPVPQWTEPEVHYVGKDWALTGARGRPSQKICSLFLKEGVLEEHNLKLQEKFKVIEETEVRSEKFLMEDKPQIIFVAYGTSARLCKEVVTRCRDRGIRAGLFRPITLWPFPYGELGSLIRDFVRRVFVVELSCGQMIEDVRLANSGKAEIGFYGRTGGSFFSVEEILENFLKWNNHSTGEDNV